MENSPNWANTLKHMFNGNLPGSPPPVQMNDAGGFGARARDFDPIALERLASGVPQLITFFGDDPADTFVDVIQVRIPAILVHFMDETLHVDTGCPNGGMHDAGVRQDVGRG